MPSKKSKLKSDNYRKPPIEFQYKKGRSGNPNGRPREKVAEPIVDPLSGGIGNWLTRMTREEAERLVTVKEGDKVTKIPAMQAVLRTMYRAAAQGDVKAARQLFEMNARDESERVKSATEFLGYVSHYKAKHLPTFDKHRQAGVAPPEIYPHPDDFVIDPSTGEISIQGPATKEEAGEGIAARRQAAAAMPRYYEIVEALDKDPTNRALKRELKQLEHFRQLLAEDEERSARHKALQIARLSLDQPVAAPDQRKRNPPRRKPTDQDGREKSNGSD